MATGFISRFRGKIKAALIYLDSSAARGIFISAAGTYVRMPNIWSNAGAPTNGGAGTLATIALPGDLLVDTANKALYQNTNTTASPTWTAIEASGGAAVITSGTIDGATIGGTTPAPVTASALHVDTGTKTAAAVAGAATLNKMAGVITSEALVTAGLADYTLTLTNSNIAAADQVFAQVGNGTNTQGDPVVGVVTPAAGSVTIRIRNAHATQALNGTLIIAFMVLKN
jgi:hypothetical protein